MTAETILAAKERIKKQVNGKLLSPEVIAEALKLGLPYTKELLADMLVTCEITMLQDQEGNRSYGVLDAEQLKAVIIEFMTPAPETEDIRGRVLELLAETPYDLTPATIAEKVDGVLEDVKEMLEQLHKVGDVYQIVYPNATVYGVISSEEMAA